MIETVVGLLFAAILLVGLAQWMRIPYPIALVIGGIFIGFLPHVPAMKIDPNLLLFAVLPPILYYAAFGTAIRDFTRHWRDIFSLALGLVVFTTLVIGVLFKWLFPEYPWALAFAFGAIVSPPDSVSATAILKRFSINSRLVTLLEGESLVNDATAIVLYKLALTALLSGSFSLMHGGLDFLQEVVVGVGVGLILGYVMQMFSRYYLEPVLGVIFSFTIPFISYLVAMHFGGSGVLAVVVNGLMGSRIIMKHRSSLRRVLGFATWDILIVLLNCFVFILIGLQLRIIAETMSMSQMLTYTGYAVLIAAAMCAVRYIWVFTRLLLAHKLCPSILKEGAIIGWSGMRGIVSLAVALALPYTVPGRNEVIFLTFVVILITLVIPGLTLPYLIRRLLPGCVRKGPEGVTREKLMKVAHEKLKGLLQKGVINQEELEFLQSYFDTQHRVLASFHSEGLNHLERARLEVIQSQRQHLIKLWEQEEIDDRLLTHMENELDIVEIHIARGELN